MGRSWFWTVWLGLACLCGCASAPALPPTSQTRTPQRIISLVPSLTEVLFSLGTGDRVVGVTRNDTYPAEVQKLPRVGDLTPDYERILALKPDLVVVDPQMQAQQIPRLRQLGLNVLAVESQSLEGLTRSLEDLGQATGTRSRARQLARQLREDLQRRRRQAHAHRPRVFVEIWSRPLMTTGSGTFVDQLITLAGGQNVYADLPAGYPQVSCEDLLQRQPEVIVLTVGEPSEAARRPGWSNLTAVRQHRVYRIESDLLVRPTLRVPQALDQLSGWFFKT